MSLNKISLPKTVIFKTIINNLNQKEFHFDLDEIFNTFISQSTLYSNIKSEFNEWLKKQIKIYFWKYEDKYIINPRIDLNSFKSNIDMSIPLKHMFYLIGKKNQNDIAECITKALSDSTGAKKAELRQNLADETTKYINNVWKKHAINIVVNIDNSIIDVYVEDKDKKNNYVPMSQRSDGFKQMVSMILSISCQSKNEDFKNYVILIDEPEIHIHPKGCEDILTELKKWGKNNLVFTSTHSIFIFDPNIDERHIIVEKKDYKTTCERINHGKSIFDDEVSRRAYGMSYWLKILPKNLILAEGISDKNLIEFFISKLYPKISFAVKPGEGSSITISASNYKNDRIPIIIVVDDDDEGRGYKTTILKDDYYTNKVFTIKDLLDTTLEKSSIEDLFPNVIINDFFNNNSNINPSRKDIKTNDKSPVIEQIKETLNLKGKDKKSLLLDAKTSLINKICLDYSKNKPSELRKEFPNICYFIDNLVKKFEE